MFLFFYTFFVVGKANTQCLAGRLWEQLHFWDSFWIHYLLRHNAFKSFSSQYIWQFTSRQFTEIKDKRPKTKDQRTHPEWAHRLRDEHERDEYHTREGCNQIRFKRNNILSSYVSLALQEAKQLHVIYKPRGALQFSNRLTNDDVLHRIRDDDGVLVGEQPEWHERRHIVLRVVGCRLQREITQSPDLT